MCYKLSALEARPHLSGRVSQAPPASTSSTLWTTARAVLERQPPSTLPTSPRVYVPPVIGPPTPLQTLSREPHDPQDAATIPLSDQLCSLNSPSVTSLTGFTWLCPTFTLSLQHPRFHKPPRGFQDQPGGWTSIPSFR